MLESMRQHEAEDALAHAYRDQMRDQIPQSDWDLPPVGAYAAYILFNLEAAWDEGHALLGLGKIDGPLETYSYYRQGSKIKAPGLMAQLQHPATFTQIVEQSGWILHGQHGKYWNEHMNAALAFWFDEQTYDAIRQVTEQVKDNPGTYDLITNNCLTFVDDALAAGGVHLLTRTGRPIRTFIPKDAFLEVRDISGAHKLRAWKYWFPLSEPPKNGLPFIPDRPGYDHDRTVGSERSVC